MILVPDTAPTGVSFAKLTEGFEPGLDVITPGEAEVIAIDTEKNTITLKFTTNNKVKDMTMKIEGISLNPEIKKGDKLEAKKPIGTTTEQDIKLLMRDSKKAIINNIEDYMIMNTKNILSVEQPYQFTEEEVELMAIVIEHEGAPTYMGSILNDKELGIEASKATGYVLVNRALVNYSGYGTTILEQLTAPKQYAGASDMDTYMVEKEVSVGSMQVAEWISKYDCSSVSNPDGEPMTRNVVGQSGWCACTNGTPGITCWWWIDTIKDGKATESNRAGTSPYDTFICKNDGFPED